MEDDIREQLLVLGVEADEAQLRMCAGVCARLSVDAETFAERWVAHALSASGGGLIVIDERRLGAFEKTQTNLATEGAKVGQCVDAGGDGDVIADYLSGSKADELQKDPIGTQADSQSASNAPLTKYSLRTNSGDVVCSFGKLKDCVWNNMTGDVCNVKLLNNESDEVLKSKVMYGFELLQSKASLLDDNIKYLSQYILHNANIKDCVPVKNKSQIPVNVYGRIDCDANGRLNPKSVVLQGSWDGSFGSKVPVDLEQLKQYSLFPGQIVAMTGLNLQGDKFLAHEVHSDGSHAKPSVINLDSNFSGPLHVVAACGSFTTSDSLKYDPLFDFVNYIKQYKPHVAIFIGPFLDAGNQLLTEDVFSEAYTTFFETLTEKIMTSLETASPHTQVVFVSSSKDVFHTNVYPTPPFDMKKGYKNLTLVPDPCIINVSGVNIGITGVDILMHLSREEISFPPQGPDRMGRLASHLLHQQSFYPLWPPASGLSVDTALWSDFAGINLNPHVLIVPSDFRYFIKELSGCLVVNPERLTKGVGGGSFLRMQIVSGVDSNSENVTCEIVKI